MKRLKEVWRSWWTVVTWPLSSLSFDAWAVILKELTIYCRMTTTAVIQKLLPLDIFSYKKSSREVPDDHKQMQSLVFYFHFLFFCNSCFSFSCFSFYYFSDFSLSFGFLFSNLSQHLYFHFLFYFYSSKKRIYRKVVHVFQILMHFLNEKEVNPKVSCFPNPYALS